MEKILVPYDFTEVAKHALDFACQIGNKSDAEICLINVIDHPSESSLHTMGAGSEDPMEQVYIKKLIDKVEAQLTKATVDAPYVKIDYKVKLGNPFHGLIDEITEQKADLIVMGTQGSEGLKEFFIGSHAEKVVRHATCPVITVSDKFELEPIDKIVFASDFASEDAAFIQKLKKLQETFEAKLYITKMNTPASFTSTRHDQKQIEEFVARFDIKNYESFIYNCKNEEEGIIDYAEDISADMIAIGTHQNKGLGHFLSGSIAEDVVNHAKVPVWTSHLA